MNAKEMEKHILALQDQLEAFKNSGERRSSAGELAELKAVIAGQAEKLELMNQQASLQAIQVLQTVQAASNAADMAQRAYENLSGLVESIVARVEELSAKVEGRNKSAPVKRNMTDADALAVLNGDQKDLGHKEAAAVLGLTYAQVYSCRLAFTFKHVIRDLEKTGWKAKWAKG